MAARGAPHVHDAGVVAAPPPTATAVWGAAADVALRTAYGVPEAYAHRHTLHAKDRRCHDSRLHIIVTHTNPERFRRRPQLLREFCDRVAHVEGVVLYVVECAFGTRPFEYTREGVPGHIQLRTDSEVWHKENLFNVALRCLSPSYQYVAIMDGDVSFQSPTWASDTIEELQHHPVVQMWSDAIDMGPVGEVLSHYKSFAWCYVNDMPRAPSAGVSGLVSETPVAHTTTAATTTTTSSSSGRRKRRRRDVGTRASPAVRARLTEAYDAREAYEDATREAYEDSTREAYGATSGGGGGDDGASSLLTTNGTRKYYWHPGYAWAFTRHALETLGGLFEYNIVGGGDYVVAQALIGDVRRAVYAGASTEYVALAEAFAERAARLHRNMGNVPGTVVHHFHGPKTRRKYKERNVILQKAHYNPLRDVYHDTQGVLALRPDATDLRRDLRSYFQERSDDDIRAS